MVKLCIHKLCSVLCSLFTNLLKFLWAIRHLINWHIWITLQCFEQRLLFLAHVCEEFGSLSCLPLGFLLCGLILKFFVALFVLEGDPERIK